MTLVGTSLGARLIFSCLEEIARRHELWEEQVHFSFNLMVTVVVSNMNFVGGGVGLSLIHI